MTRTLMMWMALFSFSTFAQAGRTVARVVSTEGATFTVEVLEGGVSDTETFDLWAPSGKKSVTMSVPGSGYLDRGQTASGVSLRGATPAPRAVLMKPGQVTSWADAQRAVAAFPPKVVARVVSVDGATVTLECLSGSLTNGAAIDVLTPEGVSPATVTLPSGIDLVLKGDRVKGVSLAGARLSAGAMVADRARFATLAELGPVEAPVAAPPPAAGSAIKPNPAACVFTPAELKSALGFEVGPGAGTEIPFTGGTNLSCMYSESKGFRSVTVNRTVMTVGSPAENAKSFRSILAGRLEPIPGDADGAAWQVGQGDLTDVTLHYWRNNTGTEVRVGGVASKGNAAVKAMRINVLKLRRP